MGRGQGSQAVHAAGASEVGQEKGGQVVEWGARVSEDQAIVLGGLSEGALGVRAEVVQPCLVLQTPTAG